MKPDPAVTHALAVLAARLPEALSQEGVRLLGRELAGPPAAYVPAPPPPEQAAADVMDALFAEHERTMANIRAIRDSGPDPFAEPERRSLRDALADVKRAMG